VLVVPGLGQVEGDVAAAVAGDAGADADQVAADGCGLASVSAARVRLWQMEAQVSPAAHRRHRPVSQLYASITYQIVLTT
jgi:hypothetical protein